MDGRLKSERMRTGCSVVFQKSLRFQIELKKGFMQTKSSIERLYLCVHVCIIRYSNI